MNVKWLPLLILPLLGCESDQQRRDKFFQLGNLALEDRDYQKAIQLYDQSLKVDANYALALNNRGVAKMELNHPYEAILDYNQALLKDQNYLDALFNRAYANESVGNFEKALGDAKQIERMKPDSAFVHFYKGLVLTKMRVYPEALESFNLADSLNPFNIETLINIATIHYFNKELDQANDVLVEALEIDNDDSNAANLLSLIHLEQENYRASLVEINRALDQVPNEPYFLNNRGFIYLKMDSLDLALKDINQSILLNPRNGWAYRNKGIYLIKIGSYEEAIRLLNRSLEEPDFIDEVYFYLGNAYSLSGDNQSACEAWKQGSLLNEKRSKKKLNQNCG